MTDYVVGICDVDTTGQCVQVRWGMRGKCAVTAVLVLAGCSHPTYPPTPAETLEKIGACEQNWRPECAQLDFSPLNGIERRDIGHYHVIGSSALPEPGKAILGGPPQAKPLVCEEDANGEHCTSVHWRNP